MWRRLAKRARDQAGQTLLVAAMVLMGVALTATAVFLNLDAGKRIIARIKAGNATQGNALPAVMAYYLSQSTGTNNTGGKLPCPDTAATPTGDAAATCDGTATANAGALPWKTLGLSRDQAIDGNGNFFTYVVSTDIAASGICESVATNYGGGSEITGGLRTFNLKIQDSTGSSLSAPFAIISHGANGLGARTSKSTSTEKPDSTFETQNCDPRVTTCSQSLNMGQVTNVPLVSGPFAGSQGTTAFDDQLFTPTRASLLNMCQSLTPGGALNATLSDSFDPVASANNLASTGLDSRKYSADTANVTATSDANNPGNQVARFAAAGALLATNTANYNFDPRVRPSYVSAVWSPDVGGTGTRDAGMAIVIRASAPDQASGSDIFSGNGAHGLTVRFYSGTSNVSGGTGIANNISIHDGSTTAAATSTGTFNLIRGEYYKLEVYDDGDRVWARITQVDNFSNTATVGPYATTADLTGNNQVAIVGGTNVNYIDDLIIGTSMLALRTDGTANGYVSLADTSFALTPDMGDDPNVTVEAWFRPRVLPTGSNFMTIASVWDAAATPASAESSFRLSFSTTQLRFNTSGLDGAANINEPHTVGFTPTLNEWTHVAVTYVASTGLVTFYVNGASVGTATSAIDATGLADGDEPFLVGANMNGASRADFFNGEISDVRVWKTARSAANILADYDNRLSYAITAANDVDKLILNWKFDRESGGIASTTAISTGETNSATHNGTFGSGASYVGAIANYFRPYATTVCSGYVAHTYQCDYRATLAAGLNTTVTVPANVYEIYTKMWGAGGGGFATGNINAAAGCTGPDGAGTSCVSAGGGGGFSTARISAINNTRVSGEILDIIAGGFGTGSTTYTSATPGYGNGGGGGGATALRLNTGSTVGLLAGGGGGASFSNNVLLNVASTCLALTNDPARQCGLGGPGAGAGTSTISAPDANSALCAGRGGSASPSGTNPANTTFCAVGGGDPSGTAGGGDSGTTGGAGGTSAAGNGGAGYDVLVSAEGGAGAGGGGGGAGGGEAGGYQFFAYDTATISFASGSASLVNDSISLTLTNAGFSSSPIIVTYSDTVGGKTATQMAAALAALFPPADTTTYPALQTNGISATSSGATITIYGQRALNASTTVVGAPTAGGAVTVTAVALDGGSPNCQNAGGDFTGTGTCAVQFGGTITAGNKVTMVFRNNQAGYTNPYTYSYVVKATDTTIPTLVDSIVADINANTTLSPSGCGGATNNYCITATRSSNDLQLVDSSNKAGNTTFKDGGVAQITVTTSNTLVTVTSANMIPNGATTYSAANVQGSSNGLGGGGGTGARDTVSVSTFTGQTGVALQTATVAGTLTVGNTVDITFTNSALWGSPVEKSVTIATGDTATKIASRLTAQINGDTANFQNNGISAFNVGAVITIVQTGAFTTATTRLTDTGTLGTNITFRATPSATTGYLASGSAGGVTDFNYSGPGYSTGSGYNLSPGRGGTTSASGSIDGSAGAILLFW